MTESHSICIPCWNRFNTDSAYRISEGERKKWVRLPAEDTCCFCLVQHKSGIYVRAHLSETVCRGHGEAVLTEPKFIPVTEEPKVTSSYDPSEYWLPTVEETEKALDSALEDMI